MKRVIAFLLALVLVAGYLPTGAMGVYATEIEEIAEEPIAEETLPEEPVPEENLPEEPVPEDSAPQETVPEETIPEETIPEETIPEEPLPEEPVLEEVVTEVTDPAMDTVAEDDQTVILPQGLVCRVEADGVTITDYQGSDSVLMIPAEVQGKPVTAIGSDAFLDGVGITQIILPDTITTIGSYAFAYCYDLESINIPSSVTSIGDAAFQSCKKLQSIVIPAGVKRIETDTFLNCYALTSVTLPQSLAYIGDYAFAYCEKLTGLELPGGITYIGDYAFRCCESLKYMALPSGLKVINEGAFSVCSGLEQIVLPDGLEEIGQEAFYQCKNAGSVLIPATVTKIGKQAFDQCSNLRCVLYDGTRKDAIEMDAGNTGLQKANWHAEGEACNVMLDSVKADEAGKPVLAWTKLGCTRFYEIYRATASGGPYTYLDSATGTSYVDESAQFGKCYYYKLVGFNAEGESSSMSAAKSGYCRCAQVEMKLENPNNVPVIIWEAVENATKYEVWRAEASYSKYTKIATTTALRYTDASAPRGKMSYYKVRAVGSNSNLTGNFSQIAGIGYLVSRPQLKLTLSAAGMPSLSWNAVSNVTYYEVYRSMNMDGPFELVSDQQKTGYTDITAPADSTCYYYVRAVPYAQACSTNSDVLSISVACATPNATVTTDATTGQPVIGWQEVNGAAEYEISRSNQSSGTYTVIGTTEETAFLDTTATVGATWYYKVSAITPNGTRSNASAYKSGKCICGTPAVELSLDEPTGKPRASWESVPGAKKYEVYRATSANGKYSKVATVTGCTYLDSNATVGKTWYYKVKALASNSAYNSALSQVDFRLAICAQPKVTLKRNATTGQIELSWGKITGAARYEVYRATEETGEYTLVSNQTGVTYKDTKVTADVTYCYQVKAVASNAQYSSTMAAPKSMTAVCAQPVIAVSVEAGTGLPVISWKAVQDAAQYEISRSNKSSGTYTSVGTTEDLSFVDPTATAGATWYYKVTALTAQGNPSAASAYKSGKCICSAPDVTTQVNEGTGRPVLSWEKVTGAKKYEVYRATSATGKYSRIATVTGLSYADSGATAGKTWYYKVKALASNTTYNSALSEVDSCLSVCAQPKVTAKLYASTGQPQLTWGKVTGAARYEILRSLGGEFSSVAVITTNSWLDATAPAETTCTYQVRAIAANEAYNSIFSQAASVTVACPTPVIAGTTTDATTGKPSLTWNPVEGARYYLVTRATSTKGTYSLVAEVEDTYFLDVDAVAGKTYYYKLTAVTASGTKSPVTAYKTIYSKCAAAVVAAQVNAGTGKPSLSWEKVTGAKKYEVYRATSASGKFSRIATVTGTSYTDSGATAGKTWYYQVKALAASSTYNSALSQTVSCLSVCAQPKVSVKLNTTTGQPSLSWGKITGAVRYEILRSVDGGDYESLGQQTAVTYQDTTAPAASLCSYQVIAVAAETACNSLPSAAVSVNVACPTPVILTAEADAATGCPRMSWASVEGADHYVITRATSAKGTYTKIGTTTGEFYLDASAGNKTYYYKVAAVTAAGVSSPYSGYKAIKRVMPVPVITSITLSDLGNPQIYWTEVPGAVGYEVYRSTKETSGYTKVKTTMGNSTFHIVPDEYSVYFFKVRAVMEDGSYSPYSAPVPTWSIALDRKSVSMGLNGSAELREEYVGRGKLVWSSSNTDVAIVREDGKVYSRNMAGTANITVTDGFCSASCTVKVTEPTRKTLQILTPDDTILYPGETLQLEYRYEGNGELTWSCSFPDIFTVSDTGLVTAVGVGSTLVKVTDGTNVARISIRVRPPEEKTTEMLMWKDQFLYEENTKVVGDYLYLKVRTNPNPKMNDITYTTTDQGVVSVEWDKTQDLYADELHTWLILRFNSPGTATVIITSEDRQVSQSLTFHVKEEYDCAPGKEKLTPEEFACYATEVGVEMGHRKSKVLSGYLYDWRTEEELTWENAVSMGRGNAHRVYEVYNKNYGSYDENITPPMLIVYAGWDEEVGKHLFYKGY